MLIDQVSNMIISFSLLVFTISIHNSRWHSFWKERVVQEVGLKMDCFKGEQGSLKQGLL